MSRIDELIAELCPDGVVFRPIWQLTTWDKKFNAVERFKQPEVRKYRYLLANEMTPFVVEGGDVKLLTTNDSNLWTTEAVVGGPIHEGEIIAIPWGGNAIVQYFNGRFVTSDNRIAVANDPNELSMKFLYYFIQSNLGTLASFYRGSGIKHPSMAKVLDWRIPVPPLEVQREIVRVLDQFTQLEAELEAELEARRRQYEHYRQLAMSFDNSVPRVALGDVAEVRSGWGFPNAHQGQEEGEYPFYKVSDMNLLGNETVMSIANHYVSAEVAKKLGVRPAPAGTVIFPKIGAAVATNKKRVLSVPSAYDNNVMGLVPTERVSSRFLYHWMQTFDLSRLANDSGAVPSIRKTEAEQVLIPLPDLDTQRKVADLLDKFDALVNDLNVGLPAELAARRKQYEYYRDNLLTFEEAAA